MHACQCDALWPGQGQCRPGNGGVTQIAPFNCMGRMAPCFWVHRVPWVAWPEAQHGRMSNELRGLQAAWAVKAGAGHDVYSADRAMVGLPLQMASIPRPGESRCPPCRRRSGWRIRPFSVGQPVQRWEDTNVHYNINERPQAEAMNRGLLQ